MAKAKEGAKRSAHELTSCRRTYRETRNDIAVLLDCIKEQLRVHANRHADDDGNWGLVGDLEKVRGDLKDLLAFLTPSFTGEDSMDMVEDQLELMRNLRNR